MKNSNHNITHRQETGGKFDTEHSIVSDSSDEARKLFSVASFRLLNINQWNKLCGMPSSTFQLTDHHGNIVTRPAEPGDYLRIGIPKEESADKEREFDWERIEAMDDQRNPSAEKESLSIRVKPSANPVQKKEEKADKTFKKSTVGSFEVYRNRNVVTAEIHSRDDNGAEIPLKDQKPVGMDVLHGFSIPQWKSLIRGLLDSYSGQTN